MSVPSTSSAVLGLPTGPPRPEWRGKGLRQTAVAGGPHDCFSAQEILHLTTRSALFQETELHLLGGLGSGCTVCWGSIQKAQSDLSFQEATGPEIELLRTLTLYPPEALPLPLRQTTKKARSGGVVNVLALLVESAAWLCWESPRRLLQELEYIRSLMNSQRLDGWQGLSARIDTYCVRAWVRSGDEESIRRATVALEAALLQARASGDPALLATAMAAQSELEPERTEVFLRKAVPLLPADDPLQVELLFELAAAIGQERLADTVRTLLQAVAEAEAFGDEFLAMRLTTLHYASVSAAKLAYAEQKKGRPILFGLYLSIASVLYTLCTDAIAVHPFLDEGIKGDNLALSASLMEALSGYRTETEFEERWQELSDDAQRGGQQAVALLWLADSMGQDNFVSGHLDIVKRRWNISVHDSMEQALVLREVIAGSQIDTAVLIPFLALLERLVEAN